MNEPRNPSPLELVNIAIDNAREAGHDLSREQIEFLWKIAASEASRDEIETWKQSMSERLQTEAMEKYAGAGSATLDVTSKAAVIQSGLKGLQKKLGMLFGE